MRSAVLALVKLSHGPEQDRAFSVQTGRAEGTKRGLCSTTGKQADVEQRLVAELGGLVAQHGLRAADLHPFLPQPPDEPGQLTVTLEGVVAQVAGGAETGTQKMTHPP